jgi:hypothetical protein
MARSRKPRRKAFRDIAIEGARWRRKLSRETGITRTQIAVIEADFAREQPPPSVMNDWVEAKSELYGIPRSDVDKTVAGMIGQFDNEVRLMAHEHARVVFEALGATRTRAISAIKQALEATIETVVGNGENQEVVSRPDHKTRLAAAKLMGDTFGFSMPVKMEVEHEIGDSLARLGEAELKIRYMEIAKALAMESKPKELPPAAAVIIERDADPDTRNSQTAEFTEVSRDSGGAAVPRGRKKSLPVDDSSHKNKRRAKPGPL